MEQIHGDLCFLYFVDSLAEEDRASLYVIKFINSQNFNGLPSHRINMKIGVLIILLGNLYFSIR